MCRQLQDQYNNPTSKEVKKNAAHMDRLYDVISYIVNLNIQNIHHVITITHHVLIQPSSSRPT